MMKKIFIYSFIFLAIELFLTVITVRATILMSSNDVSYETKSGHTMMVNEALDELLMRTDITTDDFKNSLKQLVIAEIYPVGSVYITTSDDTVEKVKQRLGGIWERYSEGRTLVGVGTSDKTFSINDVGGESTHVLTTDEMPRHNHYVSYGESGSTSFDSYHAIATKFGVSGGNFNSASISYAGNSQPHNNLQPYIATYMYKRI